MSRDWPRAIGQITGVMTMLLDKEMKPLKWFMSFGSLLRMIRDDGKMKDEDDIDIGLIYDSIEPHRLENSFTAVGLQIHHKIVHDVDKRPLYYNLKGQHSNYCIFLWYKHKNVYYHTYDVLMEKKSKPSRYIFKGVPCECLDGDTQELPFRDTYRLVKVPRGYGQLLDIWYPDWLTKRKHISTTRWQIEMKSCASFKDESYKQIPLKCPVTGKVWQNGTCTG